MIDKLKKLMEKKKEGKPLDENYKDAKMSMLQALKEEMSGMMKDDLTHPGMKKVTVASDDKEGLKHGLDKAKELLGSADEGSNSDQLGQDEEDEHNVNPAGPHDVDADMEEDAEEGDSEPGEEHEGEEHEHGSGLTAEEEEHLKMLLSKKKGK